MLKRKVLVLNQNYEPFSICTVKRAVVLMYQDKVHLVERYDDILLHAVSTQLPCPSVVRLNMYVHKPYKEVILNRKNVLRRDNHTCQYCGGNNRPMTIDHIIPRSFGGSDSWENLVCACLPCNAFKGDRTPEKAGLTLLRRPRKPSYLFFLQSLISHPHPTWKSYLFIEEPRD